jgi:uncharacterized RDD family membrane protein YckC
VAGPFRRFPAFLIDLVMWVLIFYVMQWLMTFLGILSFLTGSQFFAEIMTGLAHFAAFAVYWFYGGLFETFMNGQTPGKRAMGLRVLSTNGRPINGMQAVMRNFFRLADMMPMLSLEAFFVPIPGYIIPTFFLGLVVMSMNRRYQRLGDLVCGTMVVVEDRQWVVGMSKLDDPRAIQLAGFLPADLQLSRTLARTLATYVERRKYFSMARRREIAKYLGEPLLKKFGLREDTSYDLLLCALYYRAFIADRREDERHEAELRRRQSPFAGFPSRSAPVAGEQIVIDTR